MKILHDYSQDLLAQYAKISKILGINQWLTNLTSLNMDPFLYIYRFGCSPNLLPALTQKHFEFIL